MDTLGSRVPIGALSDVEKFLNSAAHLKGLLISRQERQQRRSGVDAAIARLIESHTAVCDELAKKSPRVAQMWKETQSELRALSPPDMSNQGGR